MIELAFLLLALIWGLLVLLMFVATALLTLWVAWDIMAACILRYAKAHQQQDQIEALEKLYHKK